MLKLYLQCQIVACILKISCMKQVQSRLGKWQTGKEIISFVC